MRVTDEALAEHVDERDKKEACIRGEARPLPSQP
jgi:hypothetical protein